ncbi:hypothetical protein ACWYVZ_06650 [Pediococcus acidilactici]
MKQIEVQSKLGQVNLLIKNEKVYLVYLGEKRPLDEEWLKVVSNNELASFKLTEINITGEEDHFRTSMVKNNGFNYRSAGVN